MTNYHETYENNRLEAHPEIAPYFNDINKETAARAYHGTSHSPERAGSIIRSDYALMLLEDKQSVVKSIERAMKHGATVPDDHTSSVDSWFESHRAGLKAKFLAYLSSHANVMSSFITGPANFPVSRMQKRSGWADTHYENIGKFRHTSKKQLLKALLPYGDGTAIRTDDPDAVVKIQSKLEQLEARRDTMKAANKAFRKYYKKGVVPAADDGVYDKCIAALVDIGLKDGTARLAIKPDFMGDCTPFTTYQLTNLGAEIRRQKERETEVGKTQSIEINDKFDNGIEVSISDDGKIIIEFGFKPDDETRAKLKSRAFKWSRNRVAWVRKLTLNAASAYNREIKPVLESIAL